MSDNGNVCGKWINQNGSCLHIEAISDGQLTGHFESRKGRAAEGVQYPIAGIQNGELLSFLVSFDDGTRNLHAITGFSGRLAGNRLHTMWILARQFEDDAHSKPTEPWNTFLVNADVFTRQDSAV